MGVGDEIELEVTLRPAERFAAVYAEHFDPLVRLAALLLGSTAAAEDVVQEAFAKLEPRLSSVVVPPAWLRTAVVNGCRNERRRLGTIRRHASRLAIGSPTGSARSSCSGSTSTCLRPRSLKSSASDRAL